MHEVLSAFLDNEPFDAQELSAALATAEGRDVLLDLVALRTIAQPVEPATAPVHSRRPLWILASAAAALVALVSGYQFGRSVGDSTSTGSATSVAVTAPAPTQVLTFEQGVNWTESSRSGGN